MKRFLSERNLKFLLYEVLEVEKLTAYGRFEGHDRLFETGAFQRPIGLRADSGLIKNEERIRHE